MGMTLEAGKEMDRRCVWNWLNDVYRNPKVAFNTYSDEQQIEFAHDALVLLKEQEAKPVLNQNDSMGFATCPSCKKIIIKQQIDFSPTKYCGRCGQAVKWE